LSNKKGILKKVQEEVVAEYNKKSTYKAQPRMRPSYVGHPCHRNIFYSYLRVESDFPFGPKEVNNFQNGDMQASKLKAQLRTAGLLVDYRDKFGNIPKHWKTKEPDTEFDVDSELLNMKNAKIDGVLILKDIEGYEDGLWLLEIKTTKEKNKKYMSGPKPEHLIQGSLYVHTFEEHLLEGKYAHIPELKPFNQLQGIVFIYASRDTEEWDWVEYKIPKEDTSEEFIKTAEKLLTVMDNVDNNILPSKTEHWCDYCPFKVKCGENYNPLKKQL
jgi:hypothetical protein